jgi:flagellar basal-body rod modification protein FlgD
MLSSTAAPTTPSTGTNGSSTAQSAANATTPGLASNFNEFLQLLTTQLQHQDPTSPLDPNQFTTELVQFASVEQQINTNSSLTTLISLQQTQQAAEALNFVGSTVAVSGTTAQLTKGQATWNYSVSQPATANISITNSSGRTIYTTSQTVQPGSQTFSWNGIDNNGTKWPDGSYTIAINAVGANNQSVQVTTQVQGVVTGVNVAANPPTLTIGGQSYPLSSISQVLSGSQTGAMSSLTSSINNIGSTVGSAVTQALQNAGL